ncbi:hypothetical protein DICPUDRAFT_158714, partial [Dictyostelium purpureum]
LPLELFFWAGKVAFGPFINTYIAESMNTCNGCEFTGLNFTKTNCAFVVPF